MCMDKTADGDKLTVQAYLDNFVTSHKDQCVLDNFIKELNGVFSKGKKKKKSTNSQTATVVLLPV